MSGAARLDQRQNVCAWEAKDISEARHVGSELPSRPFLAASEPLRPNVAGPKLS
jgi:hypothetical protein